MLISNSNFVYPKSAFGVGEFIVIAGRSLSTLIVASSDVTECVLSEMLKKNSMY